MYYLIDLELEYIVIAQIRHDPAIGDHMLPHAHQLRTQIFRVTDAVGVPLLYMPLMYGSTDRKREFLQTTNALLDIGVPWDITYAAVPTLYNSLLRSHGQSESYVCAIYLPFIFQWLNDYLIPLTNAAVAADDTVHINGAHDAMIDHLNVTTTNRNGTNDKCTGNDSIITDTMRYDDLRHVIYADIHLSLRSRASMTLPTHKP
jgi:hypothetical protein